MRKIPLGSVVRDVVTGLQGVTVTRAEWMHGCDTYDVQPVMDKDGKVPEPVCLDLPQLEEVSDKTAVIPPLEEPEKIIELGSYVKDLVRDIKGTVIGRCFYLNGCVRVCIQPKKESSERYEATTFWAPEQQVEIIEKSEPVIELKRQNTGGPTPCSTKIDRH